MKVGDLVRSRLGNIAIVVATQKIHMEEFIDVVWCHTGVYRSGRFGGHFVVVSDS